QLHGTDPTKADTDDDGVYDGVEVTEGRNPLSSDDNVVDYFVQIPAGQTLRYPGANLVITGNFVANFWVRIANDDLDKAAVLVQRAADAVATQFKVELVGSKVKFTVGASSVSSNVIAATPGVTGYTWLQIVASTAGTTLNLMVFTDDLGNDVYTSRSYASNFAAATLPVATGKDVVLGDTNNTTVIGYDNFALTVAGSAAIVSGFDDLGKEFENLAGATTSLMTGMTYRDPDTNGKPSDDTAFAGAGTLADPVKHAWFVVNDRVEDANDNGIKDEWEQLHFNRLLEAGEEFADADADGLNNLYEFLSATDPNVIEDHTTLDADGDTLSNIDEQLYGTNPKEKDTDDDGKTDYEEVIADRNPLSSLDNVVDHYFQVLSANTVTFPGAEFAITEDFTLSFWARVASNDLGTASVQLVKRGAELGDNQFRVDLTAAGTVKFMVGAKSVESDPILANPSETYTWFQVQASFTAGTLSLTVSYDELGNDVLVAETTTTAFATAVLPASTADVVIGGSAAFGIDAFTLAATRTVTTTTIVNNQPVTTTTVVTTPLVNATFDDLGLEAENRNGALISLMTNKAYRDPETNGTFSEAPTAGLATHQGFLVSDRVKDANANDIDDDWEQEHFGRLLAAGEEFADFDGDGLNNLYEFLSNTNPKNAFTLGKTDIDGVAVLNTVSDADFDFDKDGLSSLNEQLAGTDPREADTDDDGMTDGAEVAAGRNPLSSDDNIVDYYFALAPAEKVTFPGADIALAGDFRVSFWTKLANGLADATFVSRASDLDGFLQFKVELKSGKVVFTIGQYKVESAALPGAGWYQVTAERVGAALTLTVSYDELSNDVLVDYVTTGSIFTADLPASTGKPVVIGGAGAFGIDAFTLNVAGAAVITADFDDLGLAAENRNGAVVSLMTGKTYR
ncbi:MAG: hypothetical protein GX617_17365, partial [Lentisphaerae bacterium]|nr:hypothetical protein [Lentisphaerota bacterium]